MRLIAALVLMLLLGSCGARDTRPEIVVQRFFGECGAVYGHSIDVARAETECGILTVIINRFVAENPGIKVKINVVAWPGYPQLAAQIAAGDPPDLVTMHQSVIADYSGRGLLDPMDGVLAAAGITRDQFTDAGTRGVVKGGRAYAMPWDTIAGLWHVNTALMAKAGLMAGELPVLPRSPAELLAQARRFRAATGKPYFVQAQVNDPATHVRNLYTYLLAQDAVIFPDARHVRLATPQARAIVELFRAIDAEGLTTTNQDFSAATQSFMNGDGGIFPVGTWMIGAYDDEARQPGRPLYQHYAVVPYPRLWGHDAAFVDGHAWIMPRRIRAPEKLAAIARFLHFVAAHNRDWTRTGHLPAFRAVLVDPAFAAQPHRLDIAPVAISGAQLPDYVARQSAVQGLIGEELELAVSGAKPVDRALADAEHRVNELLAQIM